ncbi:MAG: hypothetical protein JWR09_2487 [Mucilaginibacter sp.]|nr:hypothetical protein [Mucilaginibacter sp.]
MKKTLIAAAALLCCLLNQPPSSSAVVKSKKASLSAAKSNVTWRLDRKTNTDYSGYYNNDTPDQIQVWFMDPGNDSYPQHVIFLSPNEHSGTFSVVAGTYDVKFFSPSNLQVMIIGSGKSAIGMNPTISSVDFSGSAFTFDVYDYN